MISIKCSPEPCVPTRLVFDNPLVKGQTSVIVYDEMVGETQPDKYFTKDYLKKLKY